MELEDLKELNDAICISKSETFSLNSDNTETSIDFQYLKEIGLIDTNNRALRTFKIFGMYDKIWNSNFKVSINGTEKYFPSDGIGMFEVSKNNLVLFSGKSYSTAHSVVSIDYVIYIIE